MSNLRPRSNRRAFTLIEMSVVITLLLLMVALVSPNLVAIKRSRDLQDREAALARLPAEARNEARKARVPVVLRADGDALILERYPQDTEGEREEFKRVDFAEDMRVENARAADGATDVGSFEWTIYPDGTAEPGALIFQIGSDERELALSSDGQGRWQAVGETEEVAAERWSAGELEQNAQTL